MKTLIFERTPQKTSNWTAIGPFSGNFGDALRHMEERYGRDNRDGIVDVTRRQIALVELGELDGDSIPSLHIFNVEEAIRLVSA